MKNDNLYWLRGIRYFRIKMGGIWVKTKFRGWIKADTYTKYIDYGFDPKSVMVEQDGKVTWTIENGFTHDGNK